MKPLPAFVAGLLLLAVNTGAGGGTGAGAETAVREGQLVPPRAITQEAVTPSWKKVWDRGRDLVRQGRYPEAAPVYEELLELQPHLLEARWELARLLLRLEEPEQALGHFELLREAAPEELAYGRGLAAALLATGRLKRAGELYAALVDQRPDDPELLAGLVEVRLAREQPEEALSYLERLVELRGEQSPDGERLFGVYRQLGLSGPARELARRLAQSPETSARRLQLAAEVHEESGHHRESVTYWRRLLDLDPEHAVAAARVGQYMLTTATGPEALPYLRAALAEYPDNPQLLRRLGRLYLEQRQPELARPHLEGYLAFEPYDEEVLQLALQAYNELGQPAEVLLILERLLGLAGEAAPEKILQAARIYHLQGKDEQALALYPRIMAHYPDDPALVAEQLRLLGRLGREGEIVSILTDPRWRPRLVEVLLAWQDLAPDDRQVQTALAFAYLEQHRLAAAEKLIRELANRDDTDPEFLRLRGLWREASRQPWAALQDYEQLLWVQPDRDQVRRRALVLAAELGLTERVEEHLGRLQPDYHVPPLGLEPARIGPAAFAAPLAALDPARALAYLDRLAAGRPAGEEQAVLLLARAQVLRQAGLPYEAEEQLRRALLIKERASRPPVLQALFELALDQEDYPAAETWLTALERELRFYPHRFREHLLGPPADRDDSARQGVTDHRAQPGESDHGVPQAAMPRDHLREGRLALPLPVAGDLFPTVAQPWASAARPGPWLDRQRLRLLSARGDHRGALRLLRSVLQEQKTVPDDVRLLAAGVLWHAESFWSAEQLVRELLERPEVEPEALVLAALLSRRGGRPEAGEEFFERARTWSASDPGRRLHLAGIMNRYQLHHQAATLAGQAREELPGSLWAARLQVEAWRAAGEKERAWEALETSSPAVAGLFSLRRARLELLMDLGRPLEVVELSRELAADYPWSATALTLPRARALWLQRRWRPALAELEELQQPSVAKQLAERAGVQGLSMPPDEPPGLWGRLAGSVNPREQFIDQVMTPDFAAALAPGDQRLRQEAAPLYAAYRWQRRSAMELQAKKAVERREFLAATREYERLVRDYPDQGPILYDLAGLYGRLERWEPEAAIYRRLQEKGLHYPGLKEARRRNDLQRQPRSTLQYGYLRETGRDGYLAKRREVLTASQWWAPLVGHEFDLALSHLRYRDPANLMPDFKARQAKLHYRRDVFARVELLLGLGLWWPAGDETEGRNKVLGRLEISGDFSDRLRGGVVYKREPVEDTLASVRRGISSETLSFAGAIDLLPRLEAGSAYNFRYFSDGNQTHGYDLSLNYSIFNEPTLLTAGYLYEFRDSRYGPQDEGPRLADGFAAADHPYWAPRSYWRKTFELSFRHRLGDDPFRRDRPRYYTLRYASSYDSADAGQQTLAGSLFWELNPSFIWQVGAEVVSGSDYRRRQLDLSLTYRW